eukprot:TRINITY_DN57544_c0_g1_i1.p1 TRINITY_DN57544_c0_g1~~TRINITY_DN57544_c0_g1_i1.p1  ORF type:complete len:663 (+),score=129.61 TRINITY_DN57544_c0_g1_i1:71-2059(+)
MDPGGRIVDTFRRFDTNGDGIIPRSELASVLRLLCPELADGDNLDRLLEYMDTNSDGKIQYAEFVAWITSSEDTGDADKLWNAVNEGERPVGDTTARLDAIIAMSPHLTANPTYQKARQAVADGEARQAHLLSDTLLLQLQHDANRIDAVFMNFDYSGSGTLDHSEVGAMFKYLGFPPPEEDEDAKALLEMMSSGDGTVEKEEFKHFVEQFGGCDVLFAKHRLQTLAKRESEGGGMDHLSPQEVNEELDACGIDNEARSYWKLILPESEIHAAVVLTEVQKKALSNIRHIAKVNHAKALPHLQKRVLDLGYKDMDLWTTLSWVRDFAPIIIHFHFDRMAKYLKGDTHYRSQFETGTSCGLNNRKVRERWERDLFQGAYDGCRDCERPKYGVLNVMNDYRGVVRANQYGDGYMILKDMRLRATFSPQDSANLKADRLACLDYYAHVMHEYSDDELAETLKIATTGTLGESSKITASGLMYKEAQFHGDVAFAKHVERIVLPRVDKYTNCHDSILEVCAQHGWEFCWMDEEKERREALQAADGVDDKITAWRENLKAMGNVPRDEEEVRIPEGYCARGCGKPVAPGTTRSGHPFSTCCRGCAMGFGHDVRCNRQDDERIPCKQMCGMFAAPGKSRRGNPFDTCCRGCVKGLGHDARCTQEPADA